MVRLTGRRSPRPSAGLGLEAIDRVETEEKVRSCVVLLGILLLGAEIDVEEVEEEADMIRGGEVMLSDESCVF